MIKLPFTPDMEALAQRLIWFEEPRQALADPIRLIAYALERGTHEDMSVLRRYIGDADIIEALDRAPPGIIHGRSWAYWNARVGRYPPPPLPRRAIS